MIMMQEQANDPARLWQNRGGQLLKVEKNDNLLFDYRPNPKMKVRILTLTLMMIANMNTINITKTIYLRKMILMIIVVSLYFGKIYPNFSNIVVNVVVGFVLDNILHKVHLSHL